MFLLANTNEKVNHEPSPYDWKFYLNWQGRISPRTYVIGGQVIGTAAFFAALLLFGMSMVWTAAGAKVAATPILLLLVAALCIPGSSLVVRRAHDLGWPAAFALTASLVPHVFVLVVLSARLEVLGDEFAQVQWLELATRAPFVIAAFALAGILYFWLALKKGRPEANRYGAAPP